MSRDDAEWLVELEGSARRILEILGDRDVAAMIATPFLLEAILHHLAVLGEAAGKVSNDVRRGMPELPWREMRDTRNFVVHAYFRIDPEVIWRTCRQDVPALVQAIDRLRRDGRWSDAS
ncbi:MAG: DUF86 domain-containing protein [Phycisphaerae bacterium]|nr:DUF86 domain-containing protein [Phycisphaerae bacterium]